MDNNSDVTPPVSPIESPSGPVITVNQEDTRGKKKKLIIIIAISVIAIVGIIFLILILTLPKGNTEENNANTSGNTTDVSPTSGDQSASEAEIKELVSSFKNGIEKILLSYTGGQVKVDGKVSQTYYENPPYFMPAGTPVGMPLENSYGLKIESSEKSEEANKLYQAAVLIRDSLMEDGFKKYNKVTLLDDDEQYLNSNLKILCHITVNTNPTTFSCGSTKWISDERTELSSDLAGAYRESTGEYPAVIDASEDMIEDSPYTPYQRISAKMLDSVGMFYRASKTANWEFFTETQAVLPCEQYSTDALKRAFSGEVCTNENGKNQPVIP